MPLVEVTVLRGFTPEQKESMVRAVIDAIHDSTGAQRDTITVRVAEADDPGVDLPDEANEGPIDSGGRDSRRMVERAQQEQQQQ